MKRIDLLQYITVLANLGVIVGIAFLIVELRQSHNIALTQMSLAIAANELEVGNAINANAEIWVKGNSGAHLEPHEEAIFSRLVLNVNYSFWSMEEATRAMGVDETESVDVAELALFLHRNPGAVAPWLSREELATYRGLVNPDQQLAQEWMDRVISAIEAFEQYESTAEIRAH